MLPIVQTSRRSSCVLNRLANPYALHTTTRQSADLHHTARQASDEGQRRLAKRGVCAETGKNAGVPGTPQRHLGNSALAFRGRFISRACGSKALSHGVL
jgi:hypothetical protein